MHSPSRGDLVTAPVGGEALTGELRGLLSRLDPTPPELLDHARRAFGWRTVDSELAELSFDSLLDRDLAFAARGTEDSAAQPRMLGFSAIVEGEDLAIEIEVGPSPAGVNLVGQLCPSGAATVEVQTGAGASATVPVDGLGRFVVEPLPRGPVRLSVPHHGRVVCTTWMSYSLG